MTYRGELRIGTQVKWGLVRILSAWFQASSWYPNAKWTSSDAHLEVGVPREPKSARSAQPDGGESDARDGERHRLQQLTDAGSNL